MVVRVEWPAAEIEAAGLKTDEDLSRFGAEFIQELNNAVVEATPVKTGFLRGSWFGALNAEPSGAGSVNRSPTGDMNAAAAGFKVGSTYYAINTAKYAGFVEFGTRRMSPRAFVRGTLSRVHQIAQMVAARIKQT